MTQDEINKKAQKLIKDQGLTHCFATEDGNLFYDEGYAKSHALSNKIACMKIEADGKVASEEKEVTEKKKK